METFNKKELIKSLEGDMKTYKLLLNHAKDLKKHVDEIVRSYYIGNDDDFRKELHGFKGACGTMHFEKLMGILLDMEKSSFLSATFLITAMILEWSAVEKEINKEIIILGFCS
jgi:hypothetical protein